MGETKFLCLACLAFVVVLMKMIATKAAKEDKESIAFGIFVGFLIPLYGALVSLIFIAIALKIFVLSVICYCVVNYLSSLVLRKINFEDVKAFDLRTDIEMGFMLIAYAGQYLI